MAYLETSRPLAAASDRRRPAAARPALEQALRAHAREVRQMLAAALLAGALILAVATALLLQS
jgi:hypothetical protein